MNPFKEHSNKYPNKVTWFSTGFSNNKLVLDVPALDPSTSRVHIGDESFPEVTFGEPGSVDERLTLRLTLLQAQRLREALAWVDGE